MNKIFFISLAILSLFYTGEIFAQTRNVREIKITSSVGWNGEDNYTELTIVNQNGDYLLNGNKIENELVDNFLAAIGETKIDSPQLENLGITPQWLYENVDQDLNSYLIERLQDASPAQKTLFDKSFKDPEIVKQTLPHFFPAWVTHYYPEISIEITESDGRKTKVFSDSQGLLSLPWQITKNGKKIETFNAHISRAISGLMPEKSANKKRLNGENLRGELAFEVMNAIEDQWNLLEAEDKYPETLQELRKDFEVQTAYAFIGSDNVGFFQAELWKKDFPKNFTIFAELPLEKGAVQNVEVFKRKIEDYKNLVFSVKWLKNYILAHPDEEFRLTFNFDSSFNTTLEREFTEAIKPSPKKLLVKKVKEDPDKISVLQVGSKNGLSEWLILPDGKMILFRYNYFDSLMKWKIKDFDSFKCDFGMCVGSLISENGKLISR